MDLERLQADMSPCVLTRPHVIVGTSRPSLPFCPQLETDTSTCLCAMEWFALAIILLISFLVLVLAFFALSSCLGDEFRAAFSGHRRQIVPTTYGLQYARLMGTVSDPNTMDGIELDDHPARGRRSHFDRDA